MSEMISQELLSWEDTEEDRLGPKWTVTGSWLLSNPCFWFRQSTLPRKREDSMGNTLLPSPFLWTVSATITRDVPGLPSLHSKEDEEKSVKWRKTNKNPQTNKTPGKQTKPNQNYKTNKQTKTPTNNNKKTTTTTTFALNGSRMKKQLENTGKDSKYRYSGLSYPTEERVKEWNRANKRY